MGSSGFRHDISQFILRQQIAMKTTIEIKTTDASIFPRHLEGWIMGYGVSPLKPPVNYN